MVRTAVVTVSELGDNWNARKHIRIEVTFEDLERLAELCRKRCNYNTRLRNIEEEEKEILKKCLEAKT